MKKFNYLLLGLAGLAMASCSQEDILAPGNGDGTVRFNVSLPGALGTRATELGTGYNANQLMIAVYENNDPDGTTIPTLGTPVIVSEGDFGFSTNMDEGDLTTQVNLNLVTGKSYYVAFFAASEASLEGTEPVYNFDTEKNQLKVNYGAMNSDVNVANGYECFYKLYSTGKIGADNNSFDVLLNRPVAQINWGTNDDMVTENNLYQEIINTFGENGQYIVTNASFTNVPNVMNFADLTVSGAETINLNGFAAPYEAGFPVTGYNYVAMQYVLAGQTSANSNLTLTITNSANKNATQVTNDVVVTEAPFQANYRTNIYGSLLSDNVSFNVEKNQQWSGMYNQPYPAVWDGTTVTIPTKDSEGNYVIAQPSDLAGLAAMVNGTNGQTASDLSGTTFVLEADIDMGENSLSIGSASRSSATANGNSFKGTFDGGGHTIKNISFTAPSDLDKNTAVGVFPSVSGATAVVKDVTFENLQINAGASEQAGVVGMLTDGATVSGVTVASGQISATEGAGGIVGRMTQNGTVENCENHAEIIVKQQNAGGIVGAAYYTSTEGNGMIVKGCKNYGNISGTASSSVAVGGIIGLNAGTVESCDNYGDVTGSQNSVGGIVGAQQSAGYIKNCNNSGTVSAPNATMAVGGIVGWVKYLNSSAYPKENIIEVTGCVNSGDVYGNNGAGGIVGSWYRAGYCTYNKNTANIISAKTGFVAGIIGSSQFLLEGNNGPAPDKVDDYVDMLYVENNQTTTTWDNMFGTLKSWIVYVNSSQYVTLTNNTPNQFANGEDGAN